MSEKTVNNLHVVKCHIGFPFKYYLQYERSCCIGYKNSSRVTCDTNGCKRSYSLKILEIGMILGEKIEQKVYLNQRNFVSDIQLLVNHSFLHELLMSITILNTDKQVENTRRSQSLSVFRNRSNLP